MAETANAWRQDAPGHLGWGRSPWPNSANKYLMISSDMHLNEPSGIFLESDCIPEKLKELLPRVETDEQGQRWVVTPGVGKTKLNFHEGEGEPEDQERAKASRTPDQVVADMDRDGIDIQVAYPNRGLLIFATPNRDLMYAMATAYNVWVEDTYSVVKDRVIPMAMLPTVDLERTLGELDRIGRSGFFRGVSIPNKPVYGAGDVSDANYNLPGFDPLWAKLQDMDLTITFHVSTGKDPRGARGNGGAVINYAHHCLSMSVEPLTNMCASGLLERFPKLRFATIESGIGWVPFVLQAMDEAFLKHHMWVRPKLDRLPSEYYFEHGFASFQEDPAGLLHVERDARFAECFLWANDYPHHEGCWPHSAAAIERQMGRITESQREKILGRNAVRCFGLEDLAQKRGY